MKNIYKIFIYIYKQILFFPECNCQALDRYKQKDLEISPAGKKKEKKKNIERFYKILKK